MRSSVFKTCVWVVAWTVLVLVTMSTGTAVAHDFYHAAHHNAATHGSGLCAWMCATAGAHAVTPIHPTEFFDHVRHVSARFESDCLPPAVAQLHPRAPPASL